MEAPETKDGSSGSGQGAYVLNAHNVHPEGASLSDGASLYYGIQAMARWAAG